MPSLRVLSGREVCEILARQGFAQVRQRGSHILMQKKTETSTITIPVPDHKELPGYAALYYSPVGASTVIV